MGIEAVVMGIFGYVAFLGIILLISNIKANECACQRDIHGYCKC